VKKVSQSITFLITIFLFTSLSSCGGGGGNNSPPAPPAAPVSFTVIPWDGYVTMSWSAVSGATSYNLYWSTTSGVTKANGTKIISASSSLNHSGLVNATAYYYVVTAVNAVGESAESSQASATPVNGASAADPFYGDQWHLKNTGQLGATGVAGTAGEDIDVEPAWTACGTGNTCRGEGVRIAVVDDGLEIAHEDLFANIATGLSYNYVTASTDPTNDPTDTTSGHGTEVAGIVGARDLNGLGVRGVAPRANLVGYNLLQSQTSSDESDAMTRNAVAVSVNTNSWGAPDGNGNLWSSDLAWQTAINYGLANGRGGRGIVYTWAAGNGATGSNACFKCVDNSNYDGQANFRGVMAVGAVNDQGMRSSYSERGANLWVSAPGGEFCDTHTITTTDRTGAAGDNPPGPHTRYVDYADLNYTKCMNGTSSATPMVAGAAALVLQANPNLGWRDVRVILAKTARKNDPINAEWTVNGALFHINPNYGFGVVDAKDAVALAKTYGANLPTEKTYTSLLSSPTLSIPDNNTTGVSNAITVSNSGITKIEFVGITFSADHPYSGDLEIMLTSPAGTASLLAEKHLCESKICTPYSDWVFGSANFLGEAADGFWTLTVKDLASQDTGTFQSWRIKFYGI